MSSAGSVTSASSLQMDYMKLLVSQLQNQNPLEPLDNNQMAAQLAQFSQLQQLENMNNSFAGALEISQQNYAASLIGKTVSYYQQQTDGSAAQVEGVVEQVGRDTDGNIILKVNEQAIYLEDVITIKQ